jgi:molybdopterin-guanine dinucleotide biosynthesis protein A
MGGENKALLEIGGARIVDRQIAALAPLVGEVLLIGGGVEVSGARLVEDLHPGRGPLAGIEAALHACDADALLVVGCDLPFLDGETLARVRDHDPTAQACVPRVDGNPQALHARYSRSALPAIEARLARDELRLLALLEELEVAYLDLPMSDSFTNVNTPAQLAAIRASFRA